MLETVIRKKRNQQYERWEELDELVTQASRSGIQSLDVEDVKRLCRLYRQVAIDLSQARASKEDPALLQYLNSLAARAHGQIYSTKRLNLRPFLTFITSGFALVLRRNWRVVGVSVAAFCLTTLASWLAVVRDPDLAYSLFDEHTVEYENLRLEKQQGEYKGNFTFSVSDSPLAAVTIIGNNVRVAILGFSLGALGCVLGMFLLVYNGRMLGTFSGLLWNSGHAIDFYSLILTHGVLELSAICISTAAGFRLGWALLAPGQLPRADAMRLAARDAFGLLAGAIVMLVIAGIIEAFVTPHFDSTVRWSVAAGTGFIFALYVAFAGRGRKAKEGKAIA